MANPFDITPADPLGALNTWQGEIADTAFKQSRATREGSLATQDADKATAGHDALLAGQAFRGKVSSISDQLKPMDKLMAIADAAMSNGLFTEAEKAIAGAGQIAQMAAVQDLRAARADKAQTEARDKRISRAMELMNGVVDEDTKRMADTVFEAEFKEPSPFAGMPFSPQFKKIALGTLKNTLTQAQIDTQVSIAEKNRVMTKAEVALKEAQAALAKARADKVKDTETDLKKNGGKMATATPQEKITTGAILKKFYPDLEGADIAKEEVSQEAKAILARREAPDYAAAVTKVIKDNPGRFKEKEKGIFDTLLGRDAKTKYGADDSAPNALPLPAKGSTPVVGQKYKNASGVVKTWTAEGWQ